jgi:[ribosomal protein S18]-alanine N-acetyltransferase
MPDAGDRQIGPVRRARSADAAEIARIQAASFAEPWSQDEWSKQIAEAHALAYVVPQRQEGRAGFLLARRVADEAEIISLTVDPSARRQGIAKAMLEHLISDLGADLPCRLFLEVSVRNVAAIALYELHGFAEVGLRKAYYKEPNGELVDAKILARDVGI